MRVYTKDRNSKQPSPPAESENGGELEKHAHAKEL